MAHLVMHPARNADPARWRDLLQSRGIAVFGTDLWASDWIRMTPKQELALLIKRLKVANRGIILLHDPRAQTAAMLPGFLRYLRDNGYHVVHLVPKESAKELGVDSYSADLKHVDKRND